MERKNRIVVNSKDRHLRKKAIILLVIIALIYLNKRKRIDVSTSTPNLQTSISRKYCVYWQLGSDICFENFISSIDNQFLLLNTKFRQYLCYHESVLILLHEPAFTKVTCTWMMNKDQIKSTFGMSLYSFFELSSTQLATKGSCICHNVLSGIVTGPWCGHDDCQWKIEYRHGRWRKKNVQTKAYLDHLIQEGPESGKCLCYEPTLSLFFTDSCQNMHCKWTTEGNEKIHVSTKTALYDLIIEEGLSLLAAKRLYFAVRNKLLEVSERPSPEYKWTDVAKSEPDLLNTVANHYGFVTSSPKSVGGVCLNILRTFSHKFPLSEILNTCQISNYCTAVTYHKDMMMYFACSGHITHKMTGSILYLKKDCEQRKTYMAGIVKCSNEATCTDKSFPSLDFSEYKERCDLCKWRCPELYSSKTIPGVFSNLGQMICQNRWSIFQPALVRHRGDYITLFRLSNNSHCTRNNDIDVLPSYHSYLYLCTSKILQFKRKDCSVIHTSFSTIVTKMEFSKLYQGIEDARIFSHKEELYFTGTINFEDYFGQVYPKICYGKIDLIQKEATSLTILETPDIDTFVPQKNWMPLSRGDDLYFVTFIKPFHIYLLQGDSTLVNLDIPSRYQSNSLENLRGGTPFVPHEDGYVSISHRKTVSSLGVIYDMRAVKITWHENYIAIEASQPFRLPFIQNNNLEENIQFPMGLVIDDEKKRGFISYGIDDSYPGISSFQVDNLDFHWSGYESDYTQEATALLLSDDIFIAPIVSSYLYLKQKYTNVGVLNPFFETIQDLPVIRKAKDLVEFEVPVLLVSQNIHSHWKNATVILDWDLISLPDSWYSVLLAQNEIHLVSASQALHLIEHGIPHDKLNLIKPFNGMNNNLKLKNNVYDCKGRTIVSFRSISSHQGGLDILLSAVESSEKILQRMCFIIDVPDIPAVIRESMSTLNIRGGAILAAKNYEGERDVDVFPSRMPIPRIDALTGTGRNTIIIIPETWETEFQLFSGTVVLLEINKSAKEMVEKQVILEGKRHVLEYAVHPVKVQKLALALETVLLQN